MTSAMTPALAPQPHLRPVAIWLVICAAMVFAMVVLGGATRLTESGLSMVHWKPLHFLPPMSESAWQEEFTAYQQYPEFQKKNAWMELADFKNIYWLEFSHRLWGRFIGIAFLVPFVVFAIQRRIDKPLGLKLGVLFILGGAQGALGWFMVASGLVDRPDVSQYRLAAHLLTAFVLYGALIWVALDLFRASAGRALTPVDPKVARRALTVLSAVLLVVFYGALVAGLDAGLIYNTFPLMDGQVVPSGLGDLTPWYLNLFENVMTVQFIHRVLAILLVVKVIGMWVRSRKTDLSARARMLTHGTLAMVFVQAALGVSTLLLVVPLPLALAHQSGALILFTLTLCLANELRAAPAVQESRLTPELKINAAE